MVRELDELSSLLGQALSARNWTLATAESCTGGLLAGAITATPGSSAWFERGFVTYSNESKEELLHVAPATLARYGAVSGETAREMADGAISRSRADVAIAITGIAGPDGGSAAKPVGTVWLAWRERHGNGGTQTHCFSGNRETVRYRAVTIALERLIALAKASPDSQ
ncbi:MAG: nicotinamide-nucleotide amidohydrolase family protein [Azoarcus sp.]|jgi:nicotinamide-nucleotide amidase|nr:nicotinamide-nucleotide amidohydrolase family protein [Azoarcus sp.]